MECHEFRNEEKLENQKNNLFLNHIETPNKEKSTLVWRHTNQVDELKFNLIKYSKNKFQRNRFKFGAVFY